MLQVHKILTRHDAGSRPPVVRRISLLAATMLAALASISGIAVTTGAHDGAIASALDRTAIGSASAILDSASTAVPLSTDTVLTATSATLVSPMAPSTPTPAVPSTTFTTSTTSTTLAGITSATTAPTTGAPATAPAAPAGTAVGPTPIAMSTSPPTTGPRTPSVLVPSSTTPPDAASVPAPPQPSACQPDPSSTIAALPAGGTFHGSGCYSVPYGIVIRNPVTIDGGTFVDSTTVPGPRPGEKAGGGLQAIFKVKDTHHVTIQNVHIVGSNTAGGYHPELVNQAGIDVLSSDHVTITNVTTLNTYGDGLEFWSTIRKVPATNVTVSNVTITNAGRQGITTAFLSNATFTNVNVVSQADRGIDAESDLPGIGMGNIVFNNVTAGGVSLVNYLSGPVTFNDSHIRGGIILGNGSTFPITFNRGTFTMRPCYHGLPPAGIYMPRGGNVTFNRTMISRPLPRLVAPAGYSWGVKNGGHLTFIASPFSGPPGFADATSAVTILP